MHKKFKEISRVEDGILTAMFRKILFDTGLINSLGFYLNRYRKSKGAKSNATIVKTMLEGSMTWRSFVFLIFELLRVKKMKLKVTLVHDGGNVTEHELEFDPVHTEDEKQDIKVKKLNDESVDLNKGKEKYHERITGINKNTKRRKK